MYVLFSSQEPATQHSGAQLQGIDAAWSITCNLSGHQDLVDILQECFILHFSVSEQEADWLALESSNFVQCLDVLK